MCAHDELSHVAFAAEMPASASATASALRFSSPVFSGTIAPQEAK
jgi:hypothetical protein